MLNMIWLPLASAATKPCVARYPPIALSEARCKNGCEGNSTPSAAALACISGLGENVPIL